MEAVPNSQSHKVYHITVSPGKQFAFQQWDDKGVHHCVWHVPTKRWLIIEALNFLLLFYYLCFKRIHAGFDVVNFHIAYPQLVFWGFLKYSLKKPVIISEHWSAYHYNFGVEKKLARVQNIFKHDLPLITVSRSLLKDIEDFSECKFSLSFVIPNVIDTNIFKYHERTASDAVTFLMISQWKLPKRPDIVIRAFAKLKEQEEGQTFKLRIGGYGLQLDEMKSLTDLLGLSDSVSFLGVLDPANIAVEMNRCNAFLHCSDYETFSVVCAESISCGTPVVASDVGGIREFINNTNGKLVKVNTVPEWLFALRQFADGQFDRNRISMDAGAMFSSAAVGVRYFETLKRISGAKR